MKYICLDCQTYSTPKCDLENHTVAGTGSNLRLPRKNKNSEWRDLRRIFLAWEECKQKILSANPNANVYTGKILPGFGGDGYWSSIVRAPRSLREKSYREYTLAWASSPPFPKPFPKAVSRKQKSRG